MTFNVASTIKPRRRRRTKAAIVSIEQAIINILQEIQPATVRQLFYALTVKGVIEKTEQEYQRTVCRKLTELRENGRVPFDWISDHTRWIRKPTTYSGLDQCLKATARFYRRDLWLDMPVYVEVWIEKDALAGVAVDVTEEFDVPLMVSRGYASVSYLHAAAMTIAAMDKPAHIYQFGDHDPSGVDLARDIETKLRRYAPDAEIYFERVAVTPEHIGKWKLPTRPTKMKDTRAKKFKGASVELDAIPPAQLRDLIREAIDQHVDKDQLDKLKVAEQSERAFLTSWANFTRSPEARS